MIWMIHDYGPGNRLVSFHVEMDANADVMYSHDVIDRIERDLLNQDDLVATIHFDPVIASDSHVAELRSFLQQGVASLTLAPTSTICASARADAYQRHLRLRRPLPNTSLKSRRRGAKLAAACAAVERNGPTISASSNWNPTIPPGYRNQIKTTQERGIIMDYKQSCPSTPQQISRQDCRAEPCPLQKSRRPVHRLHPGVPSPAARSRPTPMTSTPTR